MTWRVAVAAVAVLAWGTLCFFAYGWFGVSNWDLTGYLFWQGDIMAVSMHVGVYLGRWVTT